MPEGLKGIHIKELMEMGASSHQLSLEVLMRLLALARHLCLCPTGG